MKLWAHHPDGVVCEPLIELPDDAVPGETVFHPDFAKDMSEVTDLDPRPDVGWTTGDRGKTFATPPEVDPPARLATGYMLLRAMSDEAAEALKPRDLARLTARSTDAIPESSAFVERVAAVAGLTPKAWFDAAEAV